MSVLVCFDILYEWDTESMYLNSNPFQNSTLAILQGFTTLLLIWFSLISFLLMHQFNYCSFTTLLGIRAFSSQWCFNMCARERPPQSRKLLHQGGLKQYILINWILKWFGVFLFGWHFLAGWLFFFGGGPSVILYFSWEQGINAKEQSFVFSSTQLFYSNEGSNSISNNIIFQRGGNYSISFLCY